jgi:trans-aconitate methyltransferase
MPETSEHGAEHAAAHDHEHGAHDHAHGAHVEGHAHAHDPGHSHEHDEQQHGAHGHDDANWNDEEFVGRWMEGQAERSSERRRQFAMVRAVIPKLPGQEFRYLNLGAGPGDLDEMLLEKFPGAAATLVDVSLVMLGNARQRLERFGNRVEYVQANLLGSEWVGAVGDGNDLVVTTNSPHHFGDADRQRTMYAEIYSVTGHGGIVLNFDRVRTEDPALVALAGWAAEDPEAGLIETRTGFGEAPRPLSDHLDWLRDAGFKSVDVLWKDLSRALLFGVHDHFHMPTVAHSHEGNPPEAETHHHSH